MVVPLGIFTAAEASRNTVVKVRDTLPEEGHPSSGKDEQGSHDLRHQSGSIGVDVGVGRQGVENDGQAAHHRKELGVSMGQHRHSSENSSLQDHGKDDTV